jgi:FkbH-like protein
LASNLPIVLDELERDPSYNSYLKVASALESADLAKMELPALSLAILRNFTLEPMLPVLKGEIALSGYFPRIYLGEFDAIGRDIFDLQSDFYASEPDFIIMAFWLDSLSPALARRFPSLPNSEKEAEVSRVADGIAELVLALRKECTAPILLNNFPLPSLPSLGILDAQLSDGQVGTVFRLNKVVCKTLKNLRDVYWVDYMAICARIGGENGIDERHWHIGRAPLSRQAIVPIGREYAKFVRALRGQNRKCLVLDCDNTLWGKIVGEEGLGGIEIGSTYPGSCYQAFQREILNLHDRGIILALCSKNNEEDILEVLRQHPEMVLREENFATWQINWDDKVTNLKRIAGELSIGLDSLVFADDSPFECNMVRSQLPQIKVIELSDPPSTFASSLLISGCFDSLTQTSEDRNRNRMYRDQAKRMPLSQTSSSLEEYLAKLGMEIEIGVAFEQYIPRIAQLTQKTNQFNLTTHRYSESDIFSFAEDPGHEVIYIKLKDEISELGLIGVAITSTRGQELVIDTFLLSCRALGRGVEDALLNFILHGAQKKEYKRAVGLFSATKKNQQVAGFYPKHGFRLKEKGEEGERWEIVFENHQFEIPQWFKVKAQDEGKCQKMN